MATHIGTLSKVIIDVEVEQWCENHCKQNNITELKSYYQNWKECARDNFENLLITNDEVYEKFDQKLDGDDDIYHIQKNDDGTFSYVMRFYNGATYLDECLEESLERNK